MADERLQREEKERAQSNQQSPNPARRALGALLGSQGSNVSRLYDAPNAANTMSEPIASVAASIRVPENVQSDNGMQTSPVSMSSFGNLENTTASSGMVNGAKVSSPSQIAVEANNEDDGSRSSNMEDEGTDPGDGRSNKALSFPVPLLSAQMTDARRGMSLPHAGFGRDSSRSPSTKKHKCPYCSTDFTRHHNLKSHLLTHSHEKPYMCQTCDSRFRRLHDLKRHTKLHTGERPHVCPKCDRSFARGDALARHSKGQGGCAGRRSSMGSFGGDEKGGERMKGMQGQDDSMDGLMYTDEASHEPENMDEDEDADQGRRGLPSIRKHDAPLDPHHHRQLSESQNAYQSRQPRTYPPVAARHSTTGGLFPPNAIHGGVSSTSTSPGAQISSLNHYPHGASASSTYHVGGQSVFAQGGMTESPKPISPGATSSVAHPDPGIHHNRSPSLTQQLQQQQYGRRNTTQNTPPSIGLPPPLPSAGHSNAPHLPSLPGLTPPDPRYTLHSQTTGPVLGHTGVQGSHPGPSQVSGGPTSPSYHSQQGNISSTSNSHSSHGTQARVSGDGLNNMYAQGNDRLWAYVRSLEVKVDRLQDEVNSLKSQTNVGLHR